MFKLPFKARPALALSVLAGLLVVAPVSQAFNFGNMMNPNRWMGGGSDRDRYDRYDQDYYGPYGAPPYGYGGGPGYPMPYGAPGYGGMPGYGAPGFPGAPGAPGVMPGAGGFGAPGAPGVPGSAPSSGTSQAEIDALKRRIDELESQQRRPPAPHSGQPSGPPAGEWPAAPAFRPMHQY